VISAVRAIADTGQPKQDPEQRTREIRRRDGVPALTAFLSGTPEQYGCGKSLRQDEQQCEAPQQKYAPGTREKIQPERDQDDQNDGNVEFAEREDGAPEG